MEKISITTYKDIIDVRTAYNQKFENAVLFRGTHKELIPSLVEKCTFTTTEDLALKEVSLLSDFEKSFDLPLHYQNIIPKDWETRIAGREHGLSSSLMDWSNNLEFVIEFAIHDFQNKNIDFTSVWFLNKSEIEQIDINKTTTSSFTEIITPTIINYNLGAAYFKKDYSRRKFIQGGFFLKQSYVDIQKPLNKNFFFADKLLQVIIPKNVVPDIQKSLCKTIELTKSALVTEACDNSEEKLDNICDKINLKYKCSNYPSK